MSSSLIGRIFSSRNQQLLSAVRANDATRTAQMLDRGVDIEYTPPVKDLVSYSGENALHLACRLGHAECVKVLLARGAKVDAPGPDGLTPLHRWYQQANRIIQQLGWGKAGPLALPQDFMETGEVLLSSGATCGAARFEGARDPREQLMAQSPTIAKVEQFLQDKMRKSRQLGT